jgi:uncharacterized protein
MNTLDSRRKSVVERIRPFGRMAVALSGGVDSAVLLALGCEALGPESVLAVTSVSDSLPRRDLDDARRVSTRLGVEHVLVETTELALPEYRANDENRCFYCRNELFRVLREVAGDRGVSEIAYGAIKDDIGDFRPGMKAAEAWRIRAPLLEAGSVESAEDALRDLGFGQLRVRHHGDVARIELEVDDLARLIDPALRARVVDAVRSAGFRFCAIDLEGYRAGSLNLVDSDPGNPARTGGQ